MFLEIRHEETGEARTVPLGAAEVSLGKRADCDVVLADGRVSKRHARLVPEGDGCTLEDLASTNGTWVDGQALSGPTRLVAGSEFVIGPFRIRLGAATDDVAEKTAFVTVDEPPPAEAVVAPEGTGAAMRPRAAEEPVAPEATLARPVERAHPPAEEEPPAAAAHPLRDASAPEAPPAAPPASSSAGIEARSDVPAAPTEEAPPAVPRPRQESPRPASAAGSSSGVSFGPLEPLFADDSISEIMVNGPEEVFVERGGRLELSDLRFSSSDEVADLARAIARQAGLAIDARRPMADVRLPDGSRMNAILPPLSLRGPCLTIRRFPSERLTAERLVEIGALSPPMLAFLEACVAGRLSLLVSGGTGSGKTTLLNALCAYIGPGERIVTIEDAAELRLPQRHVLPLETRPPDADGGGEVTVRDLVRNALRMRPSRIVVGEVRGAEALDMLQAMNTGHEGSLSTIHANSPREALSRLETLILFAGVELPIRAVREQITGAISLIVQVERLADAKRRVTSIAELSGMEGDTFTIGEIFRWEKAADGSGKFRATGYVPRLRDRLVQRGHAVDNSWFR